MEQIETKRVDLDYQIVIKQFKSLEGKILTLLDSSIENERQVKAMKDLTKKMFSEQMLTVSKLCFPELPITSREELIEMGVDTLV